MSYRRTVDAATEPLTLSEIKEWLRVTDTNEDALLVALGKAARQAVERETNRALITQTWELTLDSFPSDRSIELPIGRLLSVTSVSYTDADGDEQTLASANYEVDTVSEPGRLVLDADASWPETEPGINKVTITFTAGYGPDASDVPEDLRIAIRYILSEWFSDRREISKGIVYVIPLRSRAIIWGYRIFNR
jgi:uncharacterized phiE125 gp8 family phage protein